MSYINAATSNLGQDYWESLQMGSALAKDTGGQVGGSIASDAEKLAKPFAL
jgi:hypothetical protein